MWPINHNSRIPSVPPSHSYNNKQGHYSRRVPVSQGLSEWLLNGTAATCRDTIALCDLGLRILSMFSSWEHAALGNPGWEGELKFLTVKHK